jgi:predicted alpha/beta hydrolase family esterase
MEQMPDSNAPKIEVWTEVLKDISGDVDEKTYFVGHSIGCQTIIRMLEKHESKKVGGAIFLAGWFHLKDFTYKEEPKLEKLKRQIAEPWINNTIDFSKVQSRFDPGTITAIFSDNDPYVDIINAEIFKQKLGARILVESGKGHYSEEEIDVLPIIVQEMLRISKEK